MKKNIQLIEKKLPLPFSILTGSPLYDVHSIFYTIQGEGPFCGVPAIFIRLAGCNLQCPGCDTDYTSTRTWLTAQNVLNRIDEMTTCARFLRLPLVVITGGEPFRQEISGLIHALDNYNVQVETNGTLPPPIDINWEDNAAHIICSPKTGKIHPLIEEFAMAFKYVLHADSVDPDDGLPILALEHPAKPRVARPNKIDNKVIYVQPMDCNNSIQNKKNERAAIASCMKYGYIFQLQLHKLIGME